MIVLKVELWPYGHEEHKKVIAESKIWNTLMKDEKGQHMYGYLFSTDGKEDPLGQGDVMHLRTKGIWALIRRALNAAEARKEDLS